MSKPINATNITSRLNSPDIEIDLLPAVIVYVDKRINPAFRKTDDIGCCLPTDLVEIQDHELRMHFLYNHLINKLLRVLKNFDYSTICEQLASKGDDDLSETIELAYSKEDVSGYDNLELFIREFVEHMKQLDGYTDNSNGKHFYTMNYSYVSHMAGVIRLVHNDIKKQILQAMVS